MRSSEFNTVERALNSTSVSFTISCLVVGKFLNLAVPLVVIEASGKWWSPNSLLCQLTLLKQGLAHAVYFLREWSCPPCGIRNVWYQESSFIFLSIIGKNKHRWMYQPLGLERLINLSWTHLQSTPSAWFQLILKTTEAKEAKQVLSF